MDRLQEKYKNEVVPELTKKFGYKNILQLPKIEKVIINMGVGEAVGNPKALDSAVNDLTIIAGQKPILTRAKKSLAAWKLREGMPIGTKVTLRGMNIVIVTTAEKDEEARELLKLMGMPFKA